MRKQATVLLAVGVCATGAATRVRSRNLGASADEVGRRLPGDEIIPDARTAATMAITIAAPPSAVWPWLVQMGCGRAGWYSYDRLDNGGVPSADRIVPAWQRLAVGDRLPSRPNGASWFEVAMAEPERVLVLRASLTVPGARPYAPAEGRPRRFSDSTWAFALEPDMEGHTRLLVRTRNLAAPRRVLAFADLVFWGPAHLIMQRRQLINLRRRIEAAG